MSECPKCGAGLTIILDTSYSKATAVLSAAELTNEALNNLKWRQSQKKPVLSTILVDPVILGVPIARLLYDRLKATPTLTWKSGDVTYKLSSFEGKEFLQRWQAAQN